MYDDLRIQLNALMKSHGISTVLAEVALAFEDVITQMPEAERWHESQQLLQKACYHARQIEHFDKVEVHGDHLKGTLNDVLQYIWITTTGNESPVQFVVGYPSIDAAVLDFLAETQIELPKFFQWERPDGVIVSLEITKALIDYLHQQLQSVLI
jgi:hypothetical protein